MRGEPASSFINARTGNSCVGEVDGFKKLVQSDVRVCTREPRCYRSGQAQHSGHWTGSEAGKSEIEPYDVRLAPANRAPEIRDVVGPIKTPTPHDPKVE